MSLNCPLCLDRGTQDWSASRSRQVPADPTGGASSTISQAWLEGRAPGAVRWRLRVRADGPASLWISWVMFGREQPNSERTQTPPSR